MNSHNKFWGYKKIKHKKSKACRKDLQMNICLSNTYRKTLRRLHFDDRPRVQKRQKVKDQQSYISTFVVYPTYLSSSLDHKPKHDKSVPWKVVWYIHRDKAQIMEKETS